MKLSVIIPVYNVAPYLKACLDSICSAARRLSPAKAVEVICVDDGSTDDSGSILDAFNLQPSTLNPQPPTFNLIVLHQANAGVSAARNRGLDAATGDWFLFVDADDFVRETWLVDVVGMIERNRDVDLVGFGKLPYYGKGDWGNDEVSERDVGIASAIDDSLVGLCVYQFAYSRRIAFGLRFPRLAVGEDLAFVAEALARSKKCVVTKRLEYGYRYREGSASHDLLSPEKIRDIIAYNRQMFNSLSKSGKRVGEAFVKGRGGEWFSGLPRIILSNSGKAGWTEVWNLWLDSMSDFSSLTCFTSRQRRHAAAVARSRARIVVWWYCLLPIWLERKVFRHFKRRGGKISKMEDK